MQLRRLELVGFKTFVDRTEMAFHPGITAIVGPNGSGKSNIMDGIRWALGETNVRLLRGARMDDLIFAGTAVRRPHSLATVALTLDNGAGLLPIEFGEVTVARSVTRGGEGEYAINGVECRLRDIQMLFLGTGLGGRSYALIGQGEVDAVLRATPLERRQWLEEAAGLARQKRQRTEAERRLGHAQAHLDRAGDLLAELEVQQQALAVQAEAALRHRAYGEELRDLELALYADEARRLLGTSRRLAAARVAEADQAASATVRADEAAAEVASIEAQVAALTAAWEAGQQALLEGADTLRAHTAQVQLAERTLEVLRAQQDHLLAEIGRLSDERDRVAEDADGLRQQAAAAGLQREKLQRELSASEAGLAEAAARAEEASAELALARAEVAGVARTLAQTRSDLAALEARAEVLGESVETAERKSGTLREAASRLALALDAARQACADARQASGGADAAVAAALECAEERRRELDAALEETRLAELEEHRLLARLASMEEAHAQFAGFEEGVRGVLLAARTDPERFPGLRGAVADLIEVPVAYQPAVASALGRRLHGLIVETRSGIDAVLGFLAASGSGGAAVLALDSLRPGSAAPAPGIAEVEARAAEVVGAEPALQPAIAALLGDVVIAADLAAAWRLFAAGYPGRIVTRDGTLLSAEGVVTAPGRATGDLAPLGRAQALASLRSAVAQAGERRRSVETRRAGVADGVAAADAAIRAARTDREAAAATLGEHAQQLARLEVEAVRVAADEAALATEAQSRGLELARRQAEVERLAADVRRLELEAGRLDGDLAVLEEDARRSAASRDAASGEVAAHRVVLAQLDGSLEALGARLRDRAATIEGLEARRAAGLQEAERVTLALAGAEARRAEASAACDAVMAGQAEARARLDRIAADRAALRDALAARQAEHQSAVEAARALEAALHRTELRCAQADAELAAAAQRLDEQYGITLEEAASRRLDGSRDEARRRQGELRAALEALGPVNLRAIEEHAAVTTRLETLRARTDDVGRAALTLRQAITLINAALRVRFDQTFVEVNREFGRLFHRLFDGGEGVLELVDDELGGEPGLEVIAQLPGKKRRSLVALSGGERVLVALALIFAMLRVHPSPFCIFDEVEAALDDLNTRRFTGLLRDLAAQTQVLIITHNKGTMAAADVLYGVTMQEPGTSSLVSVRLVPSANGQEQSGNGQEPPVRGQEPPARDDRREVRAREREAVALPAE